MSDAYRETLYRWAADHVPEGATVTKVDIDCSLRGLDPDLIVAIFYRPAGESSREDLDLHDDEDTDETIRVLSDLGRLLTELFAIEEASP